MSHKQLRNMHIEKEEIMLYQFNMRMKKTASNIVHYKYQYRCTGRERERERAETGSLPNSVRKRNQFLFLVLFFFTQDADSSEDNHYSGSGT